MSQYSPVVRKCNDRSFGFEIPVAVTLPAGADPWGIWRKTRVASLRRRAGRRRGKERQVGASRTWTPRQTERSSYQAAGGCTLVSQFPVTRPPGRRRRPTHHILTQFSRRDLRSLQTARQRACIRLALLSFRAGGIPEWRRLTTAANNVDIPPTRNLSLGVSIRTCGAASARASKDYKHKNIRRVSKLTLRWTRRTGAVKQ